MARWRLKQKHYLRVVGNEWQYVENDRVTGRPKRVNFPVPRYLDPGDFADCNYVTRGQDGVIMDGEIIVTNNDDNPRDYKFIGDPTPDMEPLDDEAKAISAKFNWKHPIESLPEQGYSQSIMQELETQMAKQAPAPASGVDQTQFNSLQSQVTELIKQNNLLVEQMLTKQGIRRM